MSDFLMRMVSRAAGLSPTITPRLAYNIVHSVTRPQNRMSHPSNIDGLISSHNSYSLNTPSRVSSGPSFEMDALGHSEVESSVARLPHDLPRWPQRASAASPDDKRIEEGAAAQDEILQQPIVVKSRISVKTDRESPDFSASKHTLPDLGKKSEIRDIRKEILESPFNQSSEKNANENGIDSETKTDGVAHSFLNELAANLSARDTNPRFRAPSPESDPVEVKIGRVEVIMENPAPPPTRPSPTRGFDDYSALRRYSPQVWNRWSRNR
jgi:hypothetical protein